MLLQQLDIYMPKQKKIIKVKVEINEVENKTKILMKTHQNNSEKEHNGLSFPDFKTQHKGRGSATTGAMTPPESKSKATKAG